MLQILKKHFGYSHFRPVQEEVIQTVLNKKDCLLLMPTGGGKSLCFQIPALMMEGTCLVISPLIALMKDQVMALQANGIAAACMNSSFSPAEEGAIMNQAREGKLKLLYVSPEKALRLPKDFYQTLKVSFIAIDEAHCISGWGHDFRPEYTRLKQLREVLPDAHVIALTATADKVTRQDISIQLQLKKPRLFVASFDRPNLSLKVVPHLREKDKIHEILQIIKRHPDSPGIVYCLSRLGTEKVTLALKGAGIKAAAYHAGMGSEERSSVQEAFSGDRLQVICATVAFGMGIDKANVRYVVHFNLPKNLEGYYQEIGRAGRDGLPSETVLFYGLQDLRTLREFADSSERKEYNLEKLKLMQEYADARICRRKILLNYFSENYTDDCGNCDICRNPPRFINGTELAQKALSAVARMNEQAAITMLINVLRGSLHGDVLEKGYDKIKTHGAGADLSYDEWKSYVMQFIQTGLLEIAYTENYALRITEYGRLVLAGKFQVNLVKPDLALNPKRSRQFSPATVHHESKDVVLFDLLRQVRMEFATKEKVSPFIVFTDQTLRTMERFQPVTQEAFLNLPGVSTVKFEKYGTAFMACIQRWCNDHGFTPPPAPKVHLTVNELKGFLDEMKAAGSRLSYRNMIDILLANKKTEFTPQEQSLSFFGKLQDQSTLKELREPVRNFFIAFVDSPVNDLVETFFAAPYYNNMDESKSKDLFRKLRQIPMERPSETINNDYILEQRKIFPRAYEPWSENELKWYEEALEFTNDISCLSNLFQRNPGSLKQVFKKMKAGVAEVEQK